MMCYLLFCTGCNFDAGVQNRKNVQSCTICMIVCWTISMWWEAERQGERESSSVEGFDAAVSGKFMLAIVLVSVAPYAHNFRILNHTSKSSNNWQYHVCTTLLDCNHKNQTIWTVRLVCLERLLNENWNVGMRYQKGKQLFFGIGDSENPISKKPFHFDIL